MIPKWMPLLWKKNNLKVSLTWEDICKDTDERSKQTNCDILSRLSYDKPKRLSIAMRHLDCGSCGACEAELTSAFDPPYLADRFGLYVVATPKEADLLGVTGAYSNNMFDAAQKTYEQMPGGRNPSPLIALIGNCALGEGPFKNASNCNKKRFDTEIWNHQENLITIPGCPPPPSIIINVIIDFYLKLKKTGKK